MLVGRDGELQLVATSLGDARFSVVHGEAGIGKTALVMEAACVASRRLVVAGALATLSWFAYLPLTRVLGEPLGGSSDSEVVAQVTAAVGDGALFLDDLQWADPETLALVAILAGTVALVAAVRRGDSEAPKAVAIAREAGGEVVELGALDAVAARALVRRARPNIGDVDLDRIVTRAGGNPLMLQELAAADRPSDTLEIALERRLSGLSSAAADALATLGLLGRPVAPELLGHGASELVEAGLLVEDGHCLAVRHELLGEAAVARLSSPCRRELHARVARLVTDPGEAATHHLAAGERELARARALEAADRAKRSGERARLLAVAARSTDGPDATPLRLRACRELLAAGEHVDVLDLALVDDADPVVSAEASLYLARARARSADPAGARAAVDDGLAIVPDDAAALRVKLLIERARLPVREGWDPVRSVQLAWTACQAAADAGVDETEALHVLARANLAAGSPDWSTHFRLAVAAARKAGDAEGELHALLGRFSGAAFFGDIDLAHRSAREGIARAHAIECPLWELEFRCLAAYIDVMCRGELEGAVRECRELRREPLVARHRNLVDTMLSLALADLGDDEAASATLQAALAPGRATPAARSMLLWVRAEADLVAGRSHRAIEGIDACELEAPRGFPVLGIAPLARSWARYSLGRDPGPVLAPSPFTTFAGAPLESEGIVAFTTPGAEDDAAKLFTRAADLWAGKMSRNELRCRWAAAEAHRRAGRVELARDLLLALEERAQPLGIQPLLRALHRSLRHTGVDRRSPRARSTAAGLTVREREVLDFVRAGRTSSEIAARLGIAASTVDSAARSAMRKLGAATRVQAAVMIAGEEQQF